VQPQPEPEPEPTPEPEPEPVPERETVATNVTPPAPEEDAGEPAASRQNLVSLDVDGLAEVYDIALEAWHSGERRGQTEKADHWRSVAAAVIDEMLAREGTGRGFDGPLPRAGGVLRRRRSRLRTQLSEACAESAQSRRADAL
jgi:pyruvate/2-oxoglutarate dehydrogenase complex dihydrolipoamide acyltransferase (E2) component